MLTLLLRRMAWLCAIAVIPGILSADDGGVEIARRPPFVPGSVYVVDGVIRIDQDRALAGGVTPNDAPGFPVTISQSGSYRLSANLAVPDPNTTAIQITADSVTLDLNGFSITGPVVCGIRPTACPVPGTGIGVQAGGDQLLGPRGVRVLNGSVRGMGNQGIMMTGDASSVEKVVVAGNAGGGMSVAGSVIQSQALQNGSFGIIATVVRDSSSVENFGDGIILNADGGVATGNTSSRNNGAGIIVQAGTVVGNSVFLSGDFGLLALCPSSIADNTIVTNGSGAMELRGAGCALSNNATRP